MDGPVPTSSVPEEEVFKTPAGVRSYFHGIYRSLRSRWVNLDRTAGNATDTWGYAAVHLARVNKGTDVINTGGWYQFDYRQENRQPMYRRVTFTWGFFYEHINQLNVLISGVEKSTFADSDKQRFLAEARALRGWLYFELVREFQHGWARDSLAPGVPLYRQPSSLANKGAPRGTLQQVYAFIHADLDFALAHLPMDRGLKSQVNLRVARGLAARIYLEQGRWEEALEAARQAREGCALDAAQYRNHFKEMEASPEVIWGFAQTQGGGSQTLEFGTPSSFFDQTGSGYGNFYVSAALVSAFSVTDVRNTFFIAGNDPGGPDRYATNKFGKPSTQKVQLVTGEEVFKKTIDFDESLVLLRAAEMYLVEAEALARLGRPEAGEVLYTLQVNRDPQKSASEASGAELVKEILLERRKELYGEGGIEWLDAKRLQLPLERSANHPAAYRMVLPPNDPRLVLKIPQKELDTNDFMDERDQNP
ncbi:RagB/SusD family nutrient uptake outer membrane protein [Paraflavisolibacter sp. H34]|uniref:RagB/SusD family nutrient uptake outer membrane protein n=1 Tax=Huijunlia imazamoxiresistens TaxID=3127457 RepID=UPI00301A337E